MTSLLTPPARPDPGAVAARPAAARRRPLRNTLRVPAELSLFAVTAAAVLSFHRLFTGWAYLGPVLLAAATSHLLAAAMRRRRVPIAVAAVVSSVCLVLIGSWVFYLSTTRYGLPGGLTWSSFKDDLGEAVTLFREEKAPVESVVGFVAGSVIGFWVVAFLADWSAFRLWAPLEATIPAASLFVFASLLGADRQRLVLTTVFFIVAVVFMLVHRAARQETSSNWVRGDGTRGARSLITSGAVLGVVALVLAAVIGPLLPGARSDALFDVKDIGGDTGTRITVSPLVDIRARLVENREIEVFTVQSAQRAYWRLTALDDFDGRVWRSSKQFDKVEGDLPQPSGPRAGNVVEQEVKVSNLAQIWLPAAYEAQSVRNFGRAVRWEPTTSTLIADKETSDGLAYTVESVIPQLDPEQLRQAVGGYPIDVARSYLSLPRDFPSEVMDLAKSITAEKLTPYEKAMALQDYFRQNYAYSTDVESGQDINRIEDFVLSARAGYCEQFAGSFAAMARSIGLPARVAVGFTPGDPDTAQPDLYRVKGRHSHAWPEVYLPNLGWVLFEPTPSRGAPNAAYTGVSEIQDSDVAPEGVPTTTTAPDPSLGSTDTSVIPEDFTGGTLPPESLQDGSTSGQVDSGASVGQLVVGITLLVIFVLLVGYVIAVPAGRRLRRRRWLAHHSSVNGTIDGAWRDATASLRLIGLHHGPEETPAEFALRADQRSGAGTQVQELAELTTAARYGREGLDPKAATRAAVLARGVAKAVEEQTTSGERIMAELDPRPLVAAASGALRRRRQREDEDSEPPPTLVASGR